MTMRLDQKTISSAAMLVFSGLLLSSSIVRANDVPLGAADFKPSPEHPYGWRGDGSGCFPGATPPLHWGSVSKGVKGLRAQATKPKDGDTGKPIPDGIIHDWLILGPLQADTAAKALQLLGEKGDKSDASPDTGDKAGAIAWKSVTS